MGALNPLNQRPASALGGKSKGFLFGTPFYLFGDSIDDETYSPCGHIFRMKSKTGGGRYQIPPLGNRGAAGMNSAFAVKDLPMMQYLWSLFGPGVVFIKHGTNLDAPNTAIIANLQTLINASLAAGHKVIVSVTPHLIGSVAQNIIDSVMPGYLGNPNVVFQRTDIAITNSGAGDQSNGQTFDTTHYNDEGSETSGNMEAATLNAWSAAPFDDLYTQDVASLLDGTFSPATGGTVTIATGTMPSGWSITRYAGDGAGAVSVVTEVVNGIAYNAIELTITGGTTATTFQISRSVTGLASPSLDDHFEGWFGFRLVSGSLNWLQWQMDSTNTGQVGGQIAYDVNRLTQQQIFRGNTKARNSVSTTVGNIFFFGAAATKSAKLRFWAPRLRRRTVPNYSPIMSVGGGSNSFGRITGTATVGQTLTAATGSWSAKPLPITFTYQWFAAGVAIAGATNSTYVLTSAEQTKTITVAITGTNATGSNTWTTYPTSAVA